MADQLRKTVLSSAFLLFCLCGVRCTELCYVDPNSGAGFYCPVDCCGDYPLAYCCDTEAYVIQSALFGSLGVLFIIGAVTCCLCKRLNRKKPVDPLADLRKKKPIQPISGNDVTPQGAKPTSATTTATPAASAAEPHPPPFTITVSPAPPAQLPSEPMYDERVYPTAATPTLTLEST